MDKVKEFFEYGTAKFWIAVAGVFLLHLISIALGEEDLAMFLFATMWQETRAIYFLMGLVAVEFVITIVPFVGIQRFLSEKLNFE